MKYFKNACANDRVMVVLNAHMDEYLNNEKSNNDDFIGNVDVRFHNFHNSEKLNFYGITK